ncbi:MAG TPA: tRNA (adenosine(37)-N6)-threonylcarbamoyltransferase complex dimerization subunit type 1 TsaB, partial [Rhodothermales bacterium]|nr:tRNA (adenosine(37)-N6)-threonylcarbamoyltransferase complex dimerization subunit type 1 TsaB [Rhodothermales bacterium]
GVDVSAGGESLGRRVSAEPRIHASMLVPTILEVLLQSGKVMKDLDAVAVAGGPGSYTGLRIGASTAKGLSFALGIPLMGIPTMNALATGFHDLQNRTALVTCLPSRKGEVYAQIWDVAESPVALTDVVVLTVDELPEFVVTTGRTEFIAIGSGAESLLRATAGLSMLSINHAAGDAERSTVDGVAVLAFQRFRSGGFEDVAGFEPFYLNEFVAKKGSSPFEAAQNR